MLSEAQSRHVRSIILVDELLQRHHIVVPVADLRGATAIVAPLVGRVHSHRVSVILRIVLIHLGHTRPVRRLLTEAKLVTLQEHGSSLLPLRPVVSSLGIIGVV